MLFYSLSERCAHICSFFLYKSHVLSLKRAETHTVINTLRFLNRAPFVIVNCSHAWCVHSLFPFIFILFSQFFSHRGTSKGGSLFSSWSLASPAVATLSLFVFALPLLLSRLKKTHYNYWTILLDIWCKYQCWQENKSYWPQWPADFSSSASVIWLPSDLITAFMFPPGWITSSVTSKSKF